MRRVDIRGRCKKREADGIVYRCDHCRRATLSIHPDCICGGVFVCNTLPGDWNYGMDRQAAEEYDARLFQEWLEREYAES